MRTTLTLEDDVAAALERLRQSRDQPLKTLVNELLRLGLQASAAQQAPRKPFHTTVVDLGECLLGDIDNIAEVLAIAEGDDHK